jgi:hypothetical protein
MALTEDQVNVIINTFGMEKLDAVGQAFQRVTAQAQASARGFLTAGMQDLGKGLRGGLEGSMQKLTEAAPKRMNMEPLKQSMLESTQAIQQMATGARTVSAGPLNEMLLKIDQLNQKLQGHSLANRKVVQSYNQFGNSVRQAYGALAQGSEVIRRSKMEMQQMEMAGRKNQGMMAGMADRSEKTWVQLNSLSAAGAGALMAFSALQGNIMGMAFRATSWVWLSV